VSHTGVAPLQSLLLAHSTQEPSAVSQTGVAPPHALTLSAVHCTQDPDTSQAGVERLISMQSWSVEHGPHI